LLIRQTHDDGKFGTEGTVGTGSKDCTGRAACTGGSGNDCKGRTDCMGTGGMGGKDRTGRSDCTDGMGAGTTGGKDCKGRSNRTDGVTGTGGSAGWGVDTLSNMRNSACSSFFPLVLAEIDVKFPPEVAPFSSKRDQSPPVPLPLVRYNTLSDDERQRVTTAFSLYRSLLVGDR